MTSLPLVFDAPKKGLPPQHLADLDPAGRREALVALGEKPFRAEQLSRHYFAGHTRDQMTDLSPALRGKLDQLMPELFTALRTIDCDEGATRKTLWRAHDGTLVESVLMRYPGRTTVCVSSQAGCGMACPFCATGQGGLTRNLSTAEITDQVVRAGEKVTNVVFMGMGVTQWPVLTTPAAPALTCGFTAPGSTDDHFPGRLEGPVRRLLAVHRRIRVVSVAGLSKPGLGRKSRCRTTTRRTCR